MNKPFLEHCIYTILHKDKLADVERQGGPATFHESSPWRTGQALWRQARDAKLDFPILLGDATDCTELVAWGLLTCVDVDGEQTADTVERVRPLRGSHRPQDLVLRSTGEHIAPDFIRPYAICLTPAFLKDEEA